MKLNFIKIRFCAHFLHLLQIPHVSLWIAPVNNKGDDDIFQVLSNRFYSRRQLHNREKHKRYQGHWIYGALWWGGGEEGVVHKKLQVYCICSCVRVVQLYTITDNTKEKYEKGIWGCHFCFTAGLHPPYSVMKFFLPLFMFHWFEKYSLLFIK